MTQRCHTMTNPFPRLFAHTLFVLFYVCAALTAHAEADAARVDFIHVNDVYQIAPIDPKGPRGGLARLATLVREIRREAAGRLKPETSRWTSFPLRGVVSVALPAIARTPGTKKPQICRVRMPLVLEVSNSVPEVCRVSGWVSICLCFVYLCV